jgi:Family of unknown function (DUF6166)
MKSYHIHRAGDGRSLGEITVKVRAAEREYALTPARSQEVWNHSPTGFEFGYGGSGPAQLALAILLDFLNDEPRAVRLHQAFKFHFIGGIDHPGGVITGEEISTWIAAQSQKP